MQSRQPPTGFSLLELVIVLVVMIGLMAIAWPNLQRPLSRTTLDEAAQTVRSAMDESRYQATLGGTPWFVRFETGSFTVTAGSLASWLADDPGLGDGLTGIASNPESTFPDAPANLNSTAPTSPSAKRSWRLPEQVRIAAVHWNLPSSAPADSATQTAQATDSDGLAGPRATDSAAVDALPTATTVADSTDESFSVDAPAQLYWLPLLASGRGRDATIVLYDQLTQQSIQVIFISSTGAIEVSR